MIKITEHAYMRAKERLSLSAESLDRLAERAYNEGLKHSDTRSRLNRWMDGLYLEHRSADNIRLYGENAFIFSKETLITVFQVPNDLRKFLKKFKK